jgi:UrcA family protein
VHVAYNDLDLKSPTGARTLLERLKQASYRACGGDPKLHTAYRTRPGKTIKVYEECRADATKRAVDQINVPLVARMHAVEERTASSDACCADHENLAALLRTS